MLSMITVDDLHGLKVQTKCWCKVIGWDLNTQNPSTSPMLRKPINRSYNLMNKAN